MVLIGRQAEMRRLQELCESPRPEFIVVYGRRRVGKTQLVREFFRGSFAFYTSGIAGGRADDQLWSFNESLREAGASGNVDSWAEAFASLKSVLGREDVTRDRASGRRVVFIDELPWLDTQKSSFRAAFERFWNMWGSAQEDLLLVVCGSATSWIVKHLFEDRGGFHNRVTARIHLEPFSLRECEELIRVNGMEFTRRQVIEAYMVFGGIPYYLNLMSRRFGLVQNIDLLCFSQQGELRNEFDELYRSLFKNADRHIAIIRALASKMSGLSRGQISQVSGYAASGALTTSLKELEACGFIRRYRDVTKKKRDALYQLIDPFSLFYLRFMEDSTDETFWADSFQGGAVRAWQGYAFELVCLLHVQQIRSALGIAGVAYTAGTWRSTSSDPGAQIDLVIDRADGVVNLCEMKFSDGPFAIGKAYAQVLRNKRVAFVRETGTRKAQHVTIVTPDGLAHNACAHDVMASITADDLFA